MKKKKVKIAMTDLDMHEYSFENTNSRVMKRS